MKKEKLLVICLLTGFFGGHYFAIGKINKGLLYFCTAGLFGIGWIYDIIRIATNDDFIKVIEMQELKSKENMEIAKAKERARVEKVNEYREEGIPYCPKCKSTHLTADKKGFGVGKAAAGAVLAGPYGLLAGGLGSRKVTITCMNCGHQFKPGRR